MTAGLHEFVRRLRDDRALVNHDDEVGGTDRRAREKPQSLAAAAKVTLARKEVERLRDTDGSKWPCRVRTQEARGRAPTLMVCPA